MASRVKIKQRGIGIHVCETSLASDEEIKGGSPRDGRMLNAWKVGGDTLTNTSQNYHVV